MDIGLLDAMRKLAWVLVVPLFIAAYFNDEKILNEHYQLDSAAVVRFTASSWFDWMLNSEDSRLWGIGWGLLSVFTWLPWGFLYSGQRSFFPNQTSGCACPYRSYSASAVCS
jgi:hypothetical protein